MNNKINKNSACRVPYEKTKDWQVGHEILIIEPLKHLKREGVVKIGRILFQGHKSNPIVTILSEGSIVLNHVNIFPKVVNLSLLPEKQRKVFEVLYG